MQLCISVFLQTQAAPSLFAGFGIVAYLALFLIESIVLRLLKWGTFWRSLLASLLMNIPSTLVGFCLLWLFGAWRSQGLEVWFVVLATWALSVAIEGGVLVLMNRDGGRQNWMASLVANTASYLLLLSMLQLP